MDTQEYKTPRERFLAEQENIRAAHNQGKDPDLHVSDEEIDELEDDMQEIDKNLGDEGHVVTSTQYQAAKLESAKHAAIEAMSETASGKHLTNEERVLLQAIVKKRKSIDDPVLKHLITQKAMQEQGYVNLKKQVKDLNDKVMRELMKASNDLVKTQGVIENIDRQILDYIEQSSKTV